MAAHEVDVLHVVAEVAVLLRVRDGVRLDRVARPLDLDARPVHCEQLEALHRAHTPEEHLESVYMNVRLLL